MLIAANVVDDIIADLSDRGGLCAIWEQIDEAVRDEIRRRWIDIVVSHLEGTR